MKAVIMAGGEGSRLRPLTCNIPKPMARLLGRPTLEYILDLLDKHCFTTAALTLGYLPDVITDYFRSGKYKNLALEFVEEKTPLGTAGGVKNATAADDDIVLVISGDAMCDFDLTAAISFHKANNADVTILAKKVKDPREYGLIVADDSGEISAFIEKPAFSQAISDIANTGIYILSKKALDLIPTEKKYDFAKNLFPLMLSKNMSLMCFVCDGYWCDIGDLDTYVSCQQDMLKGLVNCEVNGVGVDGNIYAGDAPQRAVNIVPPVYIGKNVRIDDSATIEAGAVLDDGVIIGRNVRVTASVMLENSYAASDAKLTGAIVCAGATIKESAMVFEGATIGANAVIGEKSIVNSSVKVWNNKVVPDSVTVGEHLKTGTAARSFFDDDGICGQVGVEITPEFMSRVGAAVGSLLPGARIGVGSTNHKSAEALTLALCGGIQSTGSAVMHFGSGFASQFEFLMNFCALPIGVFVSGENNVTVKILGKGGVSASRDIERNIETMLARGEFTRATAEDYGDVVEMKGVNSLYFSQLLRFAPQGLTGTQVKLVCANNLAKKTLDDVLTKLGCETEHGMQLELSPQGDWVRILDEEYGLIDAHKLFSICAIWQMRAGNDVAVPFDAPQMLDDYAKRFDVKLMRYFSCPADNSDDDARRLAKSQMWTKDGLMQAVMFLSMLKRERDLARLLELLPEFSVDMRVVEIDGVNNPAELIKQLHNQKIERVTEGVVIDFPNGKALVRPLKRGTGIRILAEAVNAEIASELCGDVEKRLKSMLDSGAKTI